ncbi:protein tumorous imaginal discs, mitochondrial-like isoform X1 [Limulus polyphemus]|uniref:Protein tumorous imaginal discs, mitochondrial-like isoform X1 n=1 Tax=Limulus polyphemus TaxID=6850 RepID=A0ABM1BYQ2_LIMPO|nr:protein tumorous imaginal discs, mitochondrial-like isoform X1 [Limulus polyphemus]
MQVGKRELFITFRVQQSDYFHRDGADVHTDATISLSQAVLGGAVRVQGIYEDITIKIPPGTSSHARIRVAGKGIKKMNSYGHGDHYIHIKIKIPQKLTREQRALLQAYAEIEENTPGTIDDITDTSEGKRLMEDPSGLVMEIRKVVKANISNDSNKIAKKLSDVKKI